MPLHVVCAIFFRPSAAVVDVFLGDLSELLRVELGVLVMVMVPAEE